MRREFLFKKKVFFRHKLEYSSGVKIGIFSGYFEENEWKREKNQRNLTMHVNLWGKYTVIEIVIGCDKIKPINDPRYVHMVKWDDNNTENPAPNRKKSKMENIWLIKIKLCKKFDGNKQFQNLDGCIYQLRQMDFNILSYRNSFFTNYCTVYTVHARLNKPLIAMISVYELICL